MMPTNPSPARRLRPVVIALGTALVANTGVSVAAAGPGLRDNPDARIFAYWPERTPDPAQFRAVALLPVSNCADAGPGSLRDTVAAAADGDVVDLSALTCATITLQTGAIATSLDNLTLTGPGQDLLAIDAGGNDRAFLHFGGGTFTLSGLTVRNGADVTTGLKIAGGGCIASAGYLVLDHATVRDCFASGEGAYGGGVYAYSLSMINSTISGNTALGANDAANTAGWGGGAFAYRLQMIDSILSGNRATNDPNDGHTSTDLGGAAVAIRGSSITSSTIAENYSYGRGGGIASLADMTIVNSTVSSNVALNDTGGGLFLRRPSALELRNSTITANQGANGGGVAIYAAASEFQSSIISGNTATAGVADVYNAYAMTVTGADNLIGAASPIIALPADTLSIDPLLGPLTDNGGVTHTHALRINSQALDAGNNAAALGTDQRGAGFPRVYGAAADIGAYEQQQTMLATPIAVPGATRWASVLLIAMFGLLGARAFHPRRFSVAQPSASRQNSSRRHRS